MRRGAWDGHREREQPTRKTLIFDCKNAGRGSKLSVVPYYNSLRRKVLSALRA